MSSKKLRFYSGPGYRLMAVLTLPPDDSKRRGLVPGIVLCHGPGGYGMSGFTEKDPLMVPVGDWLAKAGYASLRFYYRGVGDSEGPLYRLMPMEQVEDIRNAISFMQIQKGIDPDRIGLFGAAIGGGLAAYVAAVDARVKCMVSVHGSGNWRRWLKGRRTEQEWQDFLNRVNADARARVVSGKSESVNIQEVLVPDEHTRKFGEQAVTKNPEMARNLVSLESAVPMMDYQPENYVSRISPRAAMWIGAAGDLLVPNLEAKTMFNNAGDPKKLELIEGETHHGLYHGPGFEKMMRLATDWFDAYLRVIV